jgi:hypothetical protein
MDAQYRAPCQFPLLPPALSAGLEMLNSPVNPRSPDFVAKPMNCQGK